MGLGLLVICERVTSNTGRALCAEGVIHRVCHADSARHSTRRFVVMNPRVSFAPFFQEYVLVSWRLLRFRLVAEQGCRIGRLTSSHQSRTPFFGHLQQLCWTNWRHLKPQCSL